MNRRAAVTWGLIVGSVTASLGYYDVRCDRRGDNSTLTAVTRWIFHVEHPVGRAAFTATLTTASVAFHRHILKRP